jgi:hypothetical protein
LTVQKFQEFPITLLQQWIAERAGSGWLLRNKKSGQYLSIKDYTTVPGDRVVMSDYPVVWQAQEEASGSFQ